MDAFTQDAIGSVIRKQKEWCLIDMRTIVIGRMRDSPICCPLEQFVVDICDGEDRGMCQIQRRQVVRNG